MPPPSFRDRHACRPLSRRADRGVRVAGVALAVVGAAFLAFAGFILWHYLSAERVDPDADAATFLLAAAMYGLPGLALTVAGVRLARPAERPPGSARP